MDGLAFVGSGQPVRGEEAEPLLLVAGVPLLEPLRCLAMQGLTLTAEDGPVRGLLDHGVLEAILRLGPPAPLSHQVHSLELVQPLTEPAVSSGHSFEERQSEPPP